MTARQTGWPPWIAPTCRAMPWAPLAAVTVGLVVASFVVSAVTDQLPFELVVVACGAVIAAIALALDDTAYALTQPVPASVRRRLAHRLVLLVPASVAVGGLLVAVCRLGFDEAPAPLPSMAAPAALLGAAIAANVWCSRRRPDRAAEAGAAVAIGWSIAVAVLPTWRVAQTIGDAWLVHPWLVLAAAVALIAVGTGGVTS